MARVERARSEACGVVGRRSASERAALPPRSRAVGDGATGVSKTQTGLAHEHPGPPRLALLLRRPRPAAHVPVRMAGPSRTEPGPA